MPVKQGYYGLKVNENCLISSIYCTYRPSNSQVFQKLGLNDPQVLLDKITELVNIANQSPHSCSYIPRLVPNTCGFCEIFTAVSNDSLSCEYC